MVVLGSVSGREAFYYQPTGMGRAHRHGQSSPELDKGYRLDDGRSQGVVADHDDDARNRDPHRGHHQDRRINLKIGISRSVFSV